MLVTPDQRGHFVQFSGADERYLIANVGRYLFEGLRAGDGLVVIATPERCVSFLAEIMRLGGDPEDAISQGRLVLLDRDETLDAICVAGQPAADRFNDVVGGALRTVRGKRVRAYGEMVSKLWYDKRPAQAVFLEDLWGELQRDMDFALFCSYGIDVFGPEFTLTGIDPILCAHSHLLPSAFEQALDKALNSAMKELLGERVDELRDLMKANYRPAWGAVPRAESVILWLRNNVPELADAIIARTRDNYRQITKEPSWEPA